MHCKVSWQTKRLLFLIWWWNSKLWKAQKLQPRTHAKLSNRKLMMWIPCSGHHSSIPLHRIVVAQYCLCNYKMGYCMAPYSLYSLIKDFEKSQNKCKWFNILSNLLLWWHVFVPNWLVLPTQIGLLNHIKYIFVFSYSLFENHVLK